MLKVKEPILADDPYRVLQYERGVFEVVSPAGERLRFNCPPERPFVHQRAQTADCDVPGWWRIEKIIEE